MRRGKGGWRQYREKRGKKFSRNGRSEKIRTSGPCLPKTVLYQAELHSDEGVNSRLRKLMQSVSLAVWLTASKFVENPVALYNF